MWGTVLTRAWWNLSTQLKTAFRSAWLQVVWRGSCGSLDLIWQRVMISLMWLVRPKKKIEGSQQSCLYNLVLPAWVLLFEPGLEGKERLPGSSLLVFFHSSLFRRFISGTDLVQTLFLSGLFYLNWRGGRDGVVISLKLLSTIHKIFYPAHWNELLK